MSGKVKLERHEGSPYQFRAVSPGHEKVQWAVLFVLERWPDTRSGGTLGHLSVYIGESHNVVRVTLSACDKYQEVIPYAERVASALLGAVLVAPETWGVSQAEWVRWSPGTRKPGTRKPPEKS